MKKYLVSIYLLTLLSGCALTNESDEHYYEMATALTKLSAAVESAVRYKHPPAELSEQELIDFSVQHDPSLLKPFDGYTVHVLAANRHALLLLCNNESMAILEDLGCTMEMDRHRWRSSEACHFSLTTAQCP